MTAMITEARRVTVRGTMAEGATIALWLAENCPKASRQIGGTFASGHLFEGMDITFEDETEFAKFKLFHSDEFNEAARRDAEFGANQIRGWSHVVPPHANAKLTTTRQIISSALIGIDPSRFEEDDV